jgi:hypothetical protein
MGSNLTLNMTDSSRIPPCFVVNTVQDRTAKRQKAATGWDQELFPGLYSNQPKANPVQFAHLLKI